MGYNPKIPHLQAGYTVGEITHLPTIDPNFQRDIQVPRACSSYIGDHFQKSHEGIGSRNLNQSYWAIYNDLSRRLVTPNGRVVGEPCLKWPYFREIQVGEIS